MANEDVARLSVVIDANIKQLEKRAQMAERRMDRMARKMEGSGKRVDKSFTSMGNSAKAAAANIGALGTGGSGQILALARAAGPAAAGILAIGAAARSAARSGEQLKRMEGQLTAITGSAERARGLMAASFDIADETGVSLDALSQLNNRFLLAGEAVGATDEEVTQLTENVLKLGRIGGSTTSDITNGSVQLAQALASGRLQGDELRSIMENMPLLAKAIADGLGVPVGQLKQMGSDGRLLADDVFQALLSQTQKIDGQFGELAKTSDMALGRIEASMTRIFAAIDDNIGLSAAWAASLNKVADAADHVADRMGGLSLNQQLESVNAQIRAAEERATIAAGVVRIPGAAPGGAELERLRAQRADILSQIGMGALGRGAGAHTVAASPTGPDPMQVLAMQGNYGAYRRSAGGTLPASGGGAGGGARSVGPDLMAYADRLRDMAKTLEDQREALGLSGVALAKHNAEARAAQVIAEQVNAATRAGVDLSEDQIDAIWGAAEAYVGQAEALAEAQEAQEAQQQAAEDAAEAQKRMGDAVNGIADALVDVAAGTKSWEDALAALAKQILEMPAVKGGLEQIFGQLIGSIGSGLFGGGFGAGVGAGEIGNASSVLNNVQGFATGGMPPVGVPSMVGERGPELFVPQQPGRILSVPQAQAAVAGGRGGGPVTIAPAYNITYDGSEQRLNAILAENNRKLVGMVREGMARGF